MLGEFTDWARDQRDDLTGLQADIELERFGSDPTPEIYDRIVDLVHDSITMVEVAILHDDTLEDELEDNEVGQTFLARIELVIRELEWSDADGQTVRDLRDAVNGYANDDVVVFV